MSLSPDFICQTCNQDCTQYTGFGYEFDKSKCKLWTGRNVLMEKIFNEEAEKGESV